ncbi:MAG: hypothetical protein LIQ30_03345, partial [Planctomycetes bacterium]|nr:hypothetical protein [Planctomycetota bacterium]
MIRRGRPILAWLAVTGGGAAALLALAVALTLSGCAGDARPDQGANQSLVEIGERSLELGEELESENRVAEANLAYRRALWAFREHESITAEAPLLLDESLA